MIRIVIIVAAIVLVVAMLRHLNALPPEGKRAFYKKLMWGGLLAFIIFLTVTGRLHFIAAIVAAILPFAKRLAPLLRYIPMLRRLYSQVKASRMKSSLFSMSLDFRSGDLDGEVLEGPYKGRKLSDLSLNELLHLHEVVKESYPDSIAILEAYLARQRKDEWRHFEQADQSQTKQQSSDMSLQDAYAILGLEENVSKEDVIKAHRQLIQKLHPDRGGSDFLAAQVNRAKDMIMDSMGGR